MSRLELFPSSLGVEELQERIAAVGERLGVVLFAKGIPPTPDLLARFGAPEDYLGWLIQERWTRRPIPMTDPDNEGRGMTYVNEGTALYASLDRLMTTTERHHAGQPLSFAAPVPLREVLPHCDFEISGGREPTHVVRAFHSAHVAGLISQFAHDFDISAELLKP